MRDTFASDYESEGRTFESFRVRQSFQWFRRFLNWAAIAPASAVGHLLPTGPSVGDTAREGGHSNPSGFIAVVRTAFGVVDLIGYLQTATCASHRYEFSVANRDTLAAAVGTA